MFYDSAEIDEDLKCAYCDLKFTDAIKLVPDCGESICGRCYEELKAAGAQNDGRFECKACRRRHTMPEGGFSDNKSLGRILKRRRIDKPLNEKAKQLKPLVEASLPSQLSALRAFDEREHVNRHCDWLVERVNKKYDGFINYWVDQKQRRLETVAKYRHESLSSLSSKKCVQVEALRQETSARAAEIDAFISKWKDFFGRPDTVASDREIAFALADAVQHQRRMCELRNMLKWNAFDGKVLEFNGISLALERKPSSRRVRWSRDDQTIIILSKSSSRPEADKCGINRLLFLPDGKLASCFKASSDIKVYNAGDFSELFEFKGHTRSVIALLLMPNGRLASSSTDTTIKVWNLDKRKEIRTLSGHTSPVVDLKALKGGLMASYALDNSIRIWNPESSESGLLKVLSGHGNTEWAISFGVLSSENLVTCSVDPDKRTECTLTVWNPGVKTLVRSLSSGLPGVWPLLVLSDDQVALGFDNGTIKIVDLIDQSKTRTREKAHDGQVNSFAELSDGTLLSGGQDGDPTCVCYTIKFWNAKDLSLLETLKTDHSSAIGSLDISADGRLLAIGSQDGSITIVTSQDAKQQS